MGENCSATMDTETYRAATLYRLDRHKEALVILEGIFEKLSIIQDIEHHVIVKVHTYLGLVYHDLGLLNKSLEVQSIAYELSKAMYGDGDAETMSFIANIAMVYCTQGKYSKARKLFWKAFKTLKSDYGIGHSKTLQILYNIGQVYCEESNYFDAEIQFEELLGYNCNIWETTISTRY